MASFVATAANLVIGNEQSSFCVFCSVDLENN